eukprot:371699-Pelagomonas_calceolata.AAC.1
MSKFLRKFTPLQSNRRAKRVKNLSSRAINWYCIGPIGRGWEGGCQEDMKCIIRFLSSSPVLVDIHIKVLIKRRVGSVCMTGDQCVGVWIAGAVEAKVQQSIQIHIRNLRCAIAWQSWEGGLWTFKPVVREYANGSEM